MQFQEGYFNTWTGTTTPGKVLRQHRTQQRCGGHERVWWARSGTREGILFFDIRSSYTINIAWNANLGSNWVLFHTQVRFIRFWDNNDIRVVGSIVPLGLPIKITRAIHRIAWCGISDLARSAIPGVVCNTWCIRPTGAMQKRSLLPRWTTGMCSGSSAPMTGVRILRNTWRISLPCKIPGPINHGRSFFIVFRKTLSYDRVIFALVNGSLTLWTLMGGFHPRRCGPPMR